MRYEVELKFTGIALSEEFVNSIAAHAYQNQQRGQRTIRQLGLITDAPTLSSPGGVLTAQFTIDAPTSGIAQLRAVRFLNNACAVQELCPKYYSASVTPFSFWAPRRLSCLKYVGAAAMVLSLVAVCESLPAPPPRWEHRPTVEQVNADWDRWESQSRDTMWTRPARALLLIPFGVGSGVFLWVTFRRDQCATRTIYRNQHE